MRRGLSRGAVLAALVLAVPLLLSAPGRGSDPTADAQQGATTPAHPGPTCEADPAAAATAAAQHEIDRLAAQPADTDVVVLNGRGYNYGATPGERIEKLGRQALEALSDGAREAEGAREAPASAE